MNRHRQLCGKFAFQSHGSGYSPGLWHLGQASTTIASGQPKPYEQTWQMETNRSLPYTYIYDITKCSGCFFVKWLALGKASSHRIFTKADIGAHCSPLDPMVDFFSISISQIPSPGLVSSQPQVLIKKKHFAQK